MIAAFCVYAWNRETDRVNKELYIALEFSITSYITRMNGTSIIACFNSLQSLIFYILILNQNIMLRNK